MWRHQACDQTSLQHHSKPRKKQVFNVSIIGFKKRAKRHELKKMMMSLHGSKTDMGRKRADKAHKMVSSHVFKSDGMWRTGRTAQQLIVLRLSHAAQINVSGQAGARHF